MCVFSASAVLPPIDTPEADEGELCQVTIIDLGHEEPTVLLTNNFESECPALVARYAQRMLIENGISEAIQFFHLDAL